MDSPKKPHFIIFYIKGNNNIIPKHPNYPRRWRKVFLCLWRFSISILINTCVKCWNSIKFYANRLISTNRKAFIGLTTKLLQVWRSRLAKWGHQQQAKHHHQQPKQHQQQNYDEGIHSHTICKGLWESIKIFVVSMASPPNSRGTEQSKLYLYHFQR